ncbi:hypothetical protein ACW7EJ_19755, partial [Acinetobacter soli]
MIEPRLLVKGDGEELLEDEPKQIRDHLKRLTRLLQYTHIARGINAVSRAGTSEGCPTGRVVLEALAPELGVSLLPLFPL